MKTRDLMTSNPRTCPRSATLNDAAQTMWDADCGIVPVVDRTNGIDRLVGVITDRDICMAAYTTGQSLKELAIDRFMAEHPRTCSAESVLEDAQKVMGEARVRRIPVVENDGSVVGVLSLADIAREAERQRLHRSPKVSMSTVGSLLGSLVRSRSAESQ